MTNQEIAKLLRNVAAAYTIKDEAKHRFQIIAYQRAADAIDHLSSEVKDLYEDNKLDEIPGVGASIKSYLGELLKTGKVKHFETIIKEVPEAVYSLLDVPTFGPKKAYRLVKELKIHAEEDALERLLNRAKNGEIAILEGFGEKSQEDIIRAITEYRAGTTKSNRMVLPYAFELSKKILQYLRTCDAVIDAQPLGSLRRMVATVGDIDIAVASKNPNKVIDHFVSYPRKERVIEKGNASASLLLREGKQIDLMVQNPNSFGSLLQHFTGSKHHNVALREYALKHSMSLSEYGVKKKVRGAQKLEKFDSEQKLYEFLGMQWIPPEIRENQGEIELALVHKLPNLIKLEDMKGDLHVHSSYPIEPSHDLGVNTMEEMVQKAIELKYEYIGFSEHNPSVTNHSTSKIYSILASRRDKIEQLKESNKNIRIINLLEVDILASGDIALDDKALELVDAILVSIHSSFTMDRSKMTQRVIKGLSHPKAKILTHPTGRLLNERSGYDLDWESLFDFVVREKKALEINAWPTRLDLPDVLVKDAKEHGVKFVINTDSHALSQMDNMFYGVAVGKRGWAEKSDILNTLPYNEFIEWLKD